MTDWSLLLTLTRTCMDVQVCQNIYTVLLQYLPEILCH